MYIYIYVKPQCYDHAWKKSKQIPYYNQIVSQCSNDPGCLISAFARTDFLDSGS